MAVTTTADKPERIRMTCERKALTGNEAGRILEAAEDGKNLGRRANVLLIFDDDGRLESVNVYGKVA